MYYYTWDSIIAHSNVLRCDHCLDVQHHQEHRAASQFEKRVQIYEGRVDYGKVIQDYEAAGRDPLGPSRHLDRSGRERLVANRLVLFAYRRTA